MKLADIDMKTISLVKYLGVTLNKDLSFKFYINNLLITKFSRPVGIAYYPKTVFDNSAMLTMYLYFVSHPLN